MLKYKTKNIDEFIKQVQLSKANTDDIRITKILKVTKNEHGLTEKEVWPSTPTRLRMITNYDGKSFTIVTQKAPDSAYSIPVLNPSTSDYVLLKISVTPYPLDSKWKLECSENMDDSAVFHTVYSGKQTDIVIPLTNSTVPADSLQFRWIRAVSATADSIIEPVVFKFYVTRKSTLVNTESIDIAPPLLKWDFESQDPYVDSISHKKLTNYRNLSNFPDHIVNSDGVGGISHILRGIYLIEKKMCIYVGNKVYLRAESLDNTLNEYSKYGWTSLDSFNVYTTSPTPTVGDSVYNDSNTLLNYTIVDYFQPQNNTWYADTGIDINNQCTTVSGYIRWQKNYNAKNCIGYYQSNGITPVFSLETEYYGFTATFKESKAAHVNRPTTNTDGWSHAAISRSNIVDIVNDPYSEEKGYGFVVYEGLVLTDSSRKVYGMIYLRDPNSDVTINGVTFYAWTHNSENRDGYSAFTLDNVQYSTIYTLNETASTNQFYLHTSDTEPLSGYRVYLTSYKAWYRDIRFGNGHGSFYSTTLYMSTIVGKFYYNDSSLIRKDTSYRVYKAWVSGEVLSTQMLSAPQNPDPFSGVFRVSVEPIEYDGRDAVLESQKFSAVDEICVYDRIYTDDEAVDAANLLDIHPVINSHPELSVVYRDKITPVKLTVAESVYIYNPELTIYYKLTNSDYESRYGWEKMSGNGPDALWTIDLSPSISSKCYKNATDTLVDDDLIVTNKSSLLLNETPLKGNILQPFIIDEKTIAIAVVTHNYIVRQLRTIFPNLEAIWYNAQWGYIKDYQLKYTVNCSVWQTHELYQPLINTKCDDISNWHVDNYDPNELIMRDRWYTCGGLFEMTKFQYRNCTPECSVYCTAGERTDGDGNTGDYVQFVYLTLPEPMTEGSVHTVEWCGNTCSFEYSPNQYSAVIKVNQEGYLPINAQRFAYMGRCLGGTPYVPETISDFSFYVVPVDNPTIEKAIYTGEMTLRSIAGSSSGICSDKYSIGTYKNRPINGENIYELDFTNIPYCTKSALRINSVLYYRDVCEDWTGGDITSDSIVYTRFPAKDSCNGYAWYNRDLNKIVYTDTHIPTTDESCRDDYDDHTVMHPIDSINIVEHYGWTTERTTEDDWGTSVTIWSNIKTSLPSFVELENGTTISTTNDDEFVTEATTPDISGKYYIYIPHIGWSHEFIIGNQSVGHMFYTHMRGLFHQRSGCAQVRHPYTNWEYLGPSHEIIFESGFVYDPSQASDPTLCWKVDPITHEPILSAAGAKQSLPESSSAFSMLTAQDKVKNQPLYDLHGGWFDAADFDMRVQHMDIIGQLAYAYIAFPDNFTDNQLDIPESGNGIPDILSEALWGAELYRKAQRADGGICAWFEAKRHESDWPWESTLKYFASSPSIRNSVRYAISAARLARALKIASERTHVSEAKQQMLMYSRVYTESACAAFDYGTKDMVIPYIKPDDEERTPRYITFMDSTYAWVEWMSTYLNDDVTTNQFKEYGGFVFNAACALYVLTKERRFAKYITTDIVSAFLAYVNNSTNDLSRIMPFEAALDLDEDKREVCELIKSGIVSIANTWLSYQKANAYRMLYWKPGSNNYQYFGFSACHPDARGGALLAAWLITGDLKYKNGLLHALDYITGCNNLGRCWTTGMGKVSPARHLDHWFPKNIVRNDLWSPRPGITLYYQYQPYNLLYKAADIAMNLSFSGRADINCPKIQIEAMPRLLAERYNANMRNARGTLGYPVTPIMSQEPLYETEGVNVGASEYTIWETMSLKAMFTGCLMGKGFKPKYYYKQVAPAKGFKNISNLFAVLP